MDKKNYITPDGFKKLQEEYNHLLHKERPKVVEVVAWAASNGDRSENADYQYGKKRLREIDRRLHFLTERLDGAVVVNPKSLKTQVVVFGVTVQIKDEDGNLRTFQIVGEDELDPSQGRISWQSPMAKALLGKKVGDVAVVQKPAGTEEVEIEKITV